MLCGNDFTELSVTLSTATIHTVKSGLMGGIKLTFCSCFIMHVMMQSTFKCPCCLVLWWEDFLLQKKTNATSMTRRLIVWGYAAL